ncbi:MAG: hypothetical protein ACO1OB_10280 [Archangium sp.]
MGFFDFLKNGSAPRVWPELPPDIQPLFRGFEEVGIAANEAIVPLDPLLAMLRGRVEAPEVVTRLLDAVMKKNERTHRLAGVDDSGCARFIDAPLAGELSQLLPVVLDAPVDTPFALVKNDPAALQMMAMMVGGNSSDAKNPLEASQCVTVKSLIIARALVASLRRPLDFNFEMADQLSAMLNVDVSEEVASFYGLLPEGETACLMPGGALVLLGDVAALTHKKRLQAEGHAAQELLPCFIAPPLIGAVDVEGRLGPVGGIHVATREFVTPLAPDMTSLFAQWPQSVQRIFELARSAPRG